MNKIIHQSIVLKCGVKHAFHLFIDNESLKSWLTNEALIEPVIGGKYELFWDLSDKENNSTIGCKVTAIEQNKFISFEWKSPEQFKHFANNADPLTQVTIFFIPLEDSTQINLIHTGWRNSDEWEKARQWQERAWNTAFEQLNKFVNKL